LDRSQAEQELVPQPLDKNTNAKYLRSFACLRVLWRGQKPLLVGGWKPTGLGFRVCKVALDAYGLTA